MNRPLTDRFTLTNLARLTYKMRIILLCFCNNKHNSQGSWHSCSSAILFFSLQPHYMGTYIVHQKSNLGLFSSACQIGFDCWVWLQVVRERKEARGREETSSIQNASRCLTIKWNRDTMLAESRKMPENHRSLFCLAAIVICTIGDALKSTAEGSWVTPTVATKPIVFS